MTTEAQRRAAKKYNDANTIVVSIKLNRKYDADIIRYLEKIKFSRSGEVKRIIRAYLNFMFKDDII